MNNESNIWTVVIIIFAFVIGYKGVSYFIGYFKRKSVNRSPHAGSTSERESDEAARRFNEQRQQEEKESQRKAKERLEQEQREEQERRQQREKASGGSAKNEKYYARVLGLNGRENLDDITKRYRAMASLYHPDKVNHLGSKLKTVADNEMKELNEAFDYFKRKFK
jgi:hypothetical protein